MESLDKLEEAVKNFQKDFKSIGLKVSVGEGNIEALNAKSKELTKDVADLLVKKNQLIEFLGQAESTLKKEYDQKSRELNAKSEALDGQRGTLRNREIQAEAAQKEAMESKERYDKLYAEYQTKVSEINQKREAVLNALK